MFKAYIDTIKYEEGNDMYNPDLCHNGGGYHQPSIEIETISGMKLFIEDASCGEFGERVWMTLSIHGVELGSCKFDSIDGDYYSSFHRSNPLHEVAFDLADCAGYCRDFVWADEVDDL